MIIVFLFAIAVVVTYFKGYYDGRIDMAKEFFDIVEEITRDNEKRNDTKD